MGDVSSLPIRNSLHGRKSETWLRRHAVHLAAQLPERHEDAVKVIEYLMILEREFLADELDHAEAALSPRSANSILRSNPEAIPAVLPK